ncbi:MAG TPA: NAD(P)H-binding protein [Gaiellaceae bacterium]|nr:NAD(P)H-binding protein [Gaiellaceae bacterium]
MILVTGGTGFVGSKVVHALRAEERPVRVLARRPEKQERLRAWGCEVVLGDMTDAASLRRAVEGCEAVVHLVGLPPFADPNATERVMTQGTRDLVAAAKEANVARFVLMSANGVSEETLDVAPYYRAKWEMEGEVKRSGLEHVVFRPSFVFGKEGGQLPQQLMLVRWSPVTPVLGRHRMQPIWVDDVAAFFAKAFSTPEAVNRTFELGGPDRLTWEELHAEIRKVLGKRRLAFTMPPGLLRAGAVVGQLLPPLRGARAAVEMLDFGDNVVDVGPAVEAFGIEPISVEEQLRRAVARA